MPKLYLIRELAKEKRMTLTKLAEEVGITYSGLQKLMERNSTNPETIEKIANVLNIPVKVLFDEKDTELILNEESEVDSYNNNSSLKSILKEKDMEIEHLKKMLEEKERTIQILLKK